MDAGGKEDKDNRRRERGERVFELQRMNVSFCRRVRDRMGTMRSIAPIQ